MGKHSAQRRSSLPLVLVSMAVIAIAVAAFLGFRLLNGSDGSSAGAGQPVAGASTSARTTSTTSTSTNTGSAGTSTSPTSSPTSSPKSPQDAAAVAAIKGCVDRQAAAQPFVDSIWTAAQHWGDHVQGQSDINTGARTLIEVKTNTWGPTRAAGPADAAAFRSAQAGFAGAPACSNVGALQASGDLTAKLKACAAHEQALDAYLDAGGKVMGDWVTHLSEMADRDDGHINSAQAQANWIRRWQAAPANLDPYGTAAAALTSAPACSA